MVLEFKTTVQYRETFVPGQREPLTILHNLLQAGIFTKYMFYEDNGEVRIAGNELAKVLVRETEVILEGWEGKKTEQVNDPLKQVEKLLHSLSLSGWAAYGYVGFDLARFYSSYSKAIAEPLCYFLIPETELHFTKEGVRIKTTRSLEEVRQQLFVTPQPLKYQGTSLTVDESDRDEYKGKVNSAIEAIKQSRMHKAIISRPRQIQGNLDVVGTYTIGALANNSARSYCFDLAEVKGVGFSPETLMEVNEKNFVTTNPLAGTRPRGANIEEDIDLNNQLFTDAKEVKEHCLSVWLAQNEVASVCLPETVQIYNFMEVKKYRCVQHLSSRVGGQLRGDKTLWDALKVLFPGITASGIDKDKALAWIDRLENEPRGIYAGAIGWIDSYGKADLALALRSVFQYGNRVCLNAGAGIIAESISENEYIESVNKMNTMLNNLVIQQD